MPPLIITYTQCPGCASGNIANVLPVKDYTVSQTLFEVWQCNACSLRFTQQVPGEQAIGRYYQADNYISHTNTNKGLINRLYHLVRRITLQSKRSLLQKETNRKTGQLLDVGAGMGAFAGFMRQNGWQVTGLEPDADTRKRAGELYGVSLQDTSVLFQLPAESFDAITLWHVLEHVHRLHEYIAQLKKLLKPGGILFIAVPNFTSFDATIYRQYWAAYDVPRHLYHFSPNAMRTLLQQHGLRVKSVRPMWFDSFYVSMLSEKYKTGQAGLFKGVFNGFRSNLQAMRNKEQCSSLIYLVTK